MGESIDDMFSFEEIPLLRVVLHKMWVMSILLDKNKTKPRQIFDKERFWGISF